jgi:predicted PurR-regulated permease PerM
MSRPIPDPRLTFFALALAFFAYLVALLLKPFLPFLLASVLFAFVLTPLQRRLAPEIGDRTAGLVLTLGAVAAAAVPVAMLYVTFPSDADRLSRIVAQITSWGRLERRIEGTLGVGLPIQSTVENAPRRLVELFVGDLSNLASKGTHLFLGLILLLFLLFYLLKDGPQFVAWVHEMLPLPTEIEDELFEEAHVTTWAVLKSHVLVEVVQGGLAGVGLFLVGIPFAAFWTVVMVVLELLPVIGVAGVLGPAVVYLLVTGRALAAGLLLVYGLTVVTLVDDYLRARVVDRESSLHTAVVLVSVFGGIYLFGVMGVFYGPIVVALFATMVRLFDEHYVPDAE